MLLSDFSFDLPPELIAQHPSDRRDGSRLLVLDRATGHREHRVFTDLPSLLRDGDLLVRNDTKVIPARVIARRRTGGRLRILLVRETEPGVWEALATGADARDGERLVVEDAEGQGSEWEIEVLSRQAGTWRIRLGDETSWARLDALGRAPLPPYIRRPAGADPQAREDMERYQTVYAAEAGAIAAPTAGLHFTPAILEALAARGVRIASVTLHVGVGTFLPVKAERVEDHRMGSERFRVPSETAREIELARREGRRVVAVGTTVCRTLETVARTGQLEGETDIFITPGFEFRAVDALLTNFHLPEGTPLLLACAFAGRERVLEAYREAVSLRYRFFSYGDAMLIR
ncbi:MAG: tRNA preQ1(34) S-adenosylmethionine ribosyltransferase-isomerase QueA [Planctomycetota bacterium]